MQHNAETAAEYLDQLADDWKKEKLTTIRSMILDYGRGVSEDMQYKMLSYGDGERTVFHLNAQKNYVSLYTGSIDKIVGGRVLLAGYDLGKGCIRIKKNTDIHTGKLKQFIHRAMDTWQAGGDVAC